MSNAVPRLKSRVLPITDQISRWPWWAIFAAIFGLLIAWGIFTDSTYSEILTLLRGGISMTIGVTVIAYTFAVLLGLIVGLGRVSSNPFIFHLATFYVEIIRGVPTLVLLLYIAFVAFPSLIDLLNALGGWVLVTATQRSGLPFAVMGLAQFNAGRWLGIAPLWADVSHWLNGWQLRDIDNTLRTIIALSIAYSAFLAEIFRAGIQSIERGQTEAGLALGMSGWQVMWHIVLRQAIRRVLPPLGNDLIAMLKDSSLVSALGVLDITRLGINYQARSFQTIPTYNVVAYLYLVMTLLLSLGVKWLERRMARELQREG